MLKNIHIASLITSACFLTACYTIPNPGGGGGLAGFSSTASPLSANEVGTISQGSSAVGASRGRAPINSSDAKTFADNVVTLEINKATKEDASAILGNPGMKSPVSDGECWHYNLLTGGMPAVGLLYFQGQTLVGVEVVKTSFQGPIGAGTINSEIIYSKGTKLRP